MGEIVFIQILILAIYNVSARRNIPHDVVSIKIESNYYFMNILNIPEHTGGIPFQVPLDWQMRMRLPAS